jgi:hypothetical protein
VAGLAGAGVARQSANATGSRREVWPGPRARQEPKILLRRYRLCILKTCCIPGAENRQTQIWGPPDQLANL